MSARPAALAPSDTNELTQIVRAAIDSVSPLQIVGGDSKRGIGYPSRGAQCLSMTKFDRIVDYDPAELVMTVGAGVKLSKIEALLAEHGQMLAFEPQDFADIVGGQQGRSTIGGVVASGFAGSRRVSAGNVRDHVLGFAAVSGRGEAFVAGGRVVKNVTGYDVSKLMCGSWGQLAAITELTLKVLPRPKVTLTLAAHGLDIEAAYISMTRALRSQADVAAAAHLPEGVLARTSLTLFRLEGFGPSVQARASHLLSVVASPLETCEPGRADDAWSRVSAAHMPSRSADEALWRICVPSTQGVEVCRMLRAHGAGFIVDWGGALIWARTPASTAPQDIRTLAERTGGHATLMHAPDDYRSRVPARHPESPGVRALSARVKGSFDPASILDPYRFEMPAP